MRKSIAAIVVFCIALTAGCQWEINDTVNVGDGEKLSSGKTAINGNVYVGSDCEVRGSLRAVNGLVRVGSGSEVGGIQAVNGSVGLEENVRVHGSIRTVNGPVMSEAGVVIEGEIAAVNGNIELAGAQVNRDVIVHNGDITLSERTLIKGNVIIKKSKDKSDRVETIRVTVDDAVVMGNIDARDKDVKVIVTLRNGGKVEGRVINADVINE